MARGGRGGGRGGNRGRGFAQSGGKATTFQGTSGGGAFGSRSGGSRGQGVETTGSFANGNRYKVRSPGGDNTVVPGSLSGARVGPNLANAKTSGRDQKILPHVRRGAQRGRGGSTQ
jgi:hypothetical protein